MDKSKCKRGSNDCVHIVCECKRCGQRMMECDFASGDFTIEMKCMRCTRVLIAKGMTFDRLKAYAKRGQAVLKI